MKVCCDSWPNRLNRGWGNLINSKCNFIMISVGLFCMISHFLIYIFFFVGAGGGGGGGIL